MRARNIKPGFYRNADLTECSLAARLLAPALWMLADREGRLEDRPKQIKGEVFPHDNIDTEPLLQELHTSGHITRYEAGGKKYIQVEKFLEHQFPHHREKQSVIPQASGKPRARPDLGTSQPLLNPESLILNPESLATKVAIELPEWLSKDLWQSYVSYRKKLKAGFTPHAEQLNLNKLIKLKNNGENPESVVNQSIERGYTGLFPVKDDSGKKPHKILKGQFV